MVRFLIIIGVAFTAISITACPADKRCRPAESPALAGALRLGGSTTIYPLAKATAEVFMVRHRKVKITVKQSSTGEGLRDFLAGKTDISNATRAPTAKERALAIKRGIDLHLTVIANDSVALVVHRSNPLNDVTLRTLKGIFFDGTIDDWSLLTDDKKGKINVYHTNNTISGTAELFDRITKGRMGASYVSSGVQIHPTPELVNAVAKDPNGIGYTPMKWVSKNRDIKVLTVGGVRPGTRSVLDASYPFARKMYMITNGIPVGRRRHFITFMLSQTVQAMIAQRMGFIPVI